MIAHLLGLPIDASAHGSQIDRLLVYIHVLMGLLFVGWTAFFLFSLFRFRRGRSPHASYTGARTRIPFILVGIIAVIELGLEAGISSPFWKQKNAPPPAGPDVVRVRVIAQQFAWNIHYPGPDGVFGRTDIKLVDEQTNPIGLDRAGDPKAKDDLVTINQLHIPAHRPVVIELSTKDVIHGFAVPLLRLKQDAIPGMFIPLHFEATKTSDEIRQEMARHYTLPTTHDLSLLVTMADIAGSDGTVLVKKGRSLRQAELEKLAANGITSVRLGPRTPVEIACAQLCGLGHYRMRGFVTIDEPSQYEAWLKDEAENLQ